MCGVWGVTKTTDGGQTFNQVGAGYFPTSTLRDIQFIDDNIGYVVGTSATKMSKTTDGGATWTVDPLLPATTYYNVHAFSENRVMVAGSVSSTFNIRFTTNGGVFWNDAAAGTSTIYTLACFDSLVGFAGSFSGRAYKTTDGGFTWNQMTSMNAPTSSTFNSSFIDGSTLYFLDDDSLVFVSSDSGNTFTTSQYLPTGKTKQIMRGVGVNGSNMVVVGDNGYMFTSTDAGNNWSTQSEITAGGFVQGLYGDQTGKIIAVGTNGPTQVIVSDDFGASWSPVALSLPSADLRSLQMFDATNGYAVGSSGKVWKTTDGGHSFEVYAGATTIQAFNDVNFYNTQYGMVAGNGGQIWKTTDSGNSWVTISNLGNTTGQNSIAMIDSISALVAGSSIINKTTDGGTTWTPITPGIPLGPMSRIRMRSQSVGYMIGGSGTSQTGYVFKTTDAGDTWTNMNFPFNTTMLYNIDFRSDSEYVVVGYSGGVFHTTNDGQSWNQINLGLLNVVQSQVIGVNFISADTVIVGGNGSSVVKIALDPIVPVELSSFIANVNSDNISLIWTTATELNNRGFEVERKVSTSNDWTNLGFIEGRGTSSEPKTYVYQDFNVNSGISYNYRIRQTDYDGSATVYNLAETVTFGTPVNFDLAQNYPNPFNPSTTISFSIPLKSDVSVKIYDVLGNEVTTLVNETKEAGRYSVDFNASKYSSGVYFYTIKAGNFTETKKMTLIK
ncbi:MAG: T9SS type A sorting domain-containing protein [Ignavibacteriales bacterium]|nr:T9SS type A sorting domain-containing protein [Ignavibacteriales bacterium]